jgi:hypothetical protein
MNELWLKPQLRINSAKVLDILPQYAGIIVSGAGIKEQLYTCRGPCGYAVLPEAKMPDTFSVRLYLAPEFTDMQEGWKKSKRMTR